MIKLICGTTRIGKQVITPAAGWFLATPEIEERLVALGVAVYAPKGEEEAVATGCESPIDLMACENTAEDETSVESSETACANADQLQDMTNAKLRELAEEMGIDAKKLKNKAQLIEAIANSEALPSLNAEDSVI